MSVINKIIKKYIKRLIKTKVTSNDFDVYIDEMVMQKMIKEIELEALKEYCAKCEKINSMIP